MTSGSPSSLRPPRNFLKLHLGLPDAAIVPSLGEVAVALRRKAAEMASTAAAASSQGCISWALRQRGLGGGGARAVPVLPRRRFCVSAAAGAGFDNENREWVFCSLVL